MRQTYADTFEAVYVVLRDREVTIMQSVIFAEYLCSMNYIRQYRSSYVCNSFEFASAGKMYTTLGEKDSKHASSYHNLLRLLGWKARIFSVRWVTLVRQQSYARNSRNNVISSASLMKQRRHNF